MDKVDKVDLVLQRIDRLENMLNMLTAANRFKKLQSAAQALGVSSRRLRQYCEEGLVPCNLIGEGKTNKHYEVDVEAARSIIGSNIAFQKHIRK